jgi:hypothetical protein
MIFDGVDMAPTWQSLTETFGNDATQEASRQQMFAALIDMGLIDQMRGDPARGLAFQAQALASCRLYQIPAQTTPPRLTLLGFVTAGKINANTPIEFLLEGTDITLILVYVVPGLPLPPVPPHDLAFVLAGYSEEAEPVLQEIERLTAQWKRPVLNRPDKVSLMDRERLYQVLEPVDGLVIPATVRVGREVLESIGDDGFPLIVRPLDSHAGDGLEKLENAEQTAQYLARHSYAEFHVSRFVDYRSSDGLYRKYRIMFIDGKPYPAHMASSEHWMIHYLNAGMLESAEKRADEARFLDSFEHDFGFRHARALTEMAEILGLEYFGIDCSETSDGKLLVFEASTALVVHNMDSPEIFPYKGPPMQRLFTAFREMCFQKALIHGPDGHKSVPPVAVPSAIEDAGHESTKTKSAA